MNEEKALREWKMVGLAAAMTCSLLVVAAQDCPAERRPDRSPGAVSVQGMTCDSGVNPLGVDTPSPPLHWTLAAMQRRIRGIEQTGFEVLVSSSRTNLDRNIGDLWDSGRQPGRLAPSIAYGGRPLAADTVYYWKVRVWTGGKAPSSWSRTATFLTGLRPSDWIAKWIGVEATAYAAQADAASPQPLPIFRDTFEVTRPVARATLFISGLGEQETRLNGTPVTRALLTPGWTNYRKTVLYDTYDVTSLLHQGANAIGVMLGNGMYRVEGATGRYTKFIGSYGEPMLIAELHLHYADGTAATVSTSADWKTKPGPIVFSSIYGGEDYDARREERGWTRPAFIEDGWKAAVPVKGPGGELRSERLPPVETTQTYAPIRVSHPAAGVSVYDLGQNFAGRPEILVRGPRGSKVRVLAGELLDDAGRVTQASAAASPEAPVLFNYVLRGNGQEYWTPRFSYYGFRYAEVTTSGRPSSPKIKTFHGAALQDAVTTNGKFSSSDDFLARIHGLIDAAIENNMVSVLTDCPTREKLGWLEQTHLAGPSLMYNYDLSLLYRKMAMDMRDAQLPDGIVPSIAPEVVAFVDDAGHNTDFRDSPEWGSAMVLSPWTAYTFYGDKQLLRDNYKAMVAYAEYLQTRVQDGLIRYGLGDWYDIGPGAPGKSKLTGEGMTATAIYYEDLTILARVATILDKPDDSSRFVGRAVAVKNALNAQLFHSSNDSYDRGSQTADAMALALGLVPEGHRQGVLDDLVADIRRHSNHVTAGDIGFHYVVRALTDSGRSDVLYDMLTRTDRPSYGDQLKHGATALTEAWDANPKSSQDHFMLGHAEEWFYRGLGGIDFDLGRDRDKRIWIHPQIVGTIATATVRYESVLGTIRSSWKRIGTTLSLKVSVPAGATATVTLPRGFHQKVRESGHALRVGSDLLSFRDEEGLISCVLGSGEYVFEAKRRPSIEERTN